MEVLFLFSWMFIIQSVYGTGRDYIYVSTVTTWTAAESYCETTYGTTLATIIDDDDYTALEAVLTSNSVSTGKDMWVGLNDIDSDGNWVWVDGTV